MAKQQTGNAPTPPPRPPYMCEPTPNQNICLKFYWNEASQAYDLPPGGEQMNCAECEHFFP